MVWQSLSFSILSHFERRIAEVPMNEAAASHYPVMAREVLEALDLKPGQTVVDGTLGLGGHARLFAEKLAPEGIVLGLDWDSSMLQIAKERLQPEGGVQFILHNVDFRSLAQVVEQEKLSPSGILLDLGLNSAQVDDPERGMSFQSDGPLDMRMDRTRGEPAAAMLNRLTPHEIENILFQFGDERWARAIAKTIVERRKQSPLRTTKDLVDAVLASVPTKARETRIHPATRTFQAIRIAVNRELEGLREAILDGAAALAPGGTLVVLSYHSGEDRIVKNAIRTLAEEGFIDLYRRPLEPSSAEVSVNRRSRSAKLRAVRRPG